MKLTVRVLFLLLPLGGFGWVDILDRLFIQLDLKVWTEFISSVAK